MDNPLIPPESVVWFQVKQLRIRRVAVSGYRGAAPDPENLKRRNPV
jgi:hypothetical protein